MLQRMTYLKTNLTHVESSVVVVASLHAPEDGSQKSLAAVVDVTTDA